LLFQGAFGRRFTIFDRSLQLIHFLVQLRQLAPHRHIKLVQEVCNLQDIELHHLIV
jgi:hypothetical protein